jgi:hypothetical protein
MSALPALPLMRPAKIATAVMIAPGTINAAGGQTCQSPPAKAQGRGEHHVARSSRAIQRPIA